MKKAFEVKLTSRGPRGAWTFLPIPFSVESVFGTKARLSVAGTVNGFPFRNSLLPEGDGTHAMMFSKVLQAGAKAKAGDPVSVVLWPDDKEREVEVPVELAAALKKSAKAGKFFEALSPSCKKEYASWIADAKQVETKARRVAKAIDFLESGKKRLS